MVSEVLMAFEQVALAMIIGGGIVMAVCVRPLLLRLLSHKDRPEMVHLAEALSIHAWNRYNRAALAILMLDLTRMGAGIHYTAWHVCLSGTILVLFFVKFVVDRSLRKRLEEKGSAAVDSFEQKRGHCLVELLSKVILVLAICVTVFPF